MNYNKVIFYNLDNVDIFDEKGIKELEKIIYS